MTIEEVCGRAYLENMSNPRFILKRIREQDAYIKAYLYELQHSIHITRPDWEEVLNSAQERHRWFSIIYKATNFSR
jgi:hypothetical protein